MNSPTVTRDEPIPADRLAEAGVWIARLHGDDRNPALEAGFRQWLKAHPLNGRAFELTTEVWEDSQNLRRVVPFAHDIPRVSRRRFRLRLPLVAVTAALVLAAGVATLLYFQTSGVSTGVGEQRLLALEDGSRVFLNTATRVVVHFDRHVRRIELKAGEALFDVAKRPEWPFIVQAGDHQVTALGTSFVVRRDGDRTAVTLVEGKVAVSPVAPAPPSDAARAVPAKAPTASGSTTGAAEIFTLIPGQRLTFAAHQPAQLDTPSLDNAVAWRRGQVILDDTPLSNAIAEMNRYNDVKLTVEQPEAARLLVNGLFQAGDSLSFAAAVAKTYGLDVIDRPGEIVLAGLPVQR